MTSSIACFMNYHLFSCMPYVNLQSFCSQGTVNFPLLQWTQWKCCQKSHRPLYFQCISRFLQEETWKCHQEWSFNMTAQLPHSTHWTHVATISVGTSGPFTQYSWPCLVRLQLVVFTDLTIQRKWTLLFMNGCKCQSLISALMECMNLC